ncbi:hypothetical protein CO540_25865 [Micromonospora sp. WMMA2032]|uniref:hypothetical protein n=1 Tax=Micromonospora sp. WMMA2032 TaxID=2039870 RepID=UPI000C058B62|nr:hypothetical protein [Micromonospora sp. WMMA2032]ATO16848.1 hypothetical protein CO540_25865 [Micromonospora sp. WMMA2032]
MGEAERRRRRLRHQAEAVDTGAAGAHPTRETGADTAGAAGAAVETSASTSGVHDDVAPRPPHGPRRAEHGTSDGGSRSPRGTRRAEPESEPRGRRAGPTADEGERGLRGLVGSGSSQVSVTAAMRARDAARPTDDDLAEAEERMVLVRRNWVPREELPRGGR